MLNTTAESLADIHNTTIERIDYQPEESWDWGGVQHHLQEQGTLAGGLREFVLTAEHIGEFGEIYESLSSWQAESEAHAVEQLLDAAPRSGDDPILRLPEVVDRSGEALLKRSDTDYILNPRTAQSVWITVGNASVYVRQTDEGVVVDLYGLGQEANTESVGSTYAHFAELVPDEEDQDTAAMRS